MCGARNRRVWPWVGLLVLASGCRERPAPERYPEDLGEAGKPLLPTPAGGFDAKIKEGSANVVEPGEPGPERRPLGKATDTHGEPASPPPANAWSGAVQKLLTGKAPTPAAPARPGPAGAQGRGRGAAPPSTVALSAEDEAAVRELFGQYRKAYAEARFQDIAQYLVEDHRGSSRTQATPSEKLCDALKDLREEYSSSAPQTAKLASTVVTAITATGELGPIRMVDADRAAADTSASLPGVPALTYRFERSGDGWLIRLPLALTPEEAEEAASAMRDAAGKLNGLMDELDSGNLNDAAATARLMETFQGLQARMAPLAQKAEARAQSGE